MPDLLQRLDKRIENVRDQADREEFVDVELATRIRDAAARLVQSIPDDAPEDLRRLAYAAAMYFLVEDDAVSDLRSPIGFDDDRDVVNAVAEFLGRPDLRVER